VTELLGPQGLQLRLQFREAVLSHALLLSSTIAIANLPTATKSTMITTISHLASQIMIFVRFTRTQSQDSVDQKKPGFVTEYIIKADK
jgi:hypothetical protein